MNSINVALVGCGFVANDHLKAWKKLQKAKVIAVSDVNESSAKNTASLWDIPAYYTSLSELLRKEKVDIVDICTPPQTHVDLAVLAMKARANVVVEKPMAMSMVEAEKIVACQKNTGVKAGVIHNWLFDAPVLAATSLVNKGLLGEVYSVEIETLNTKEDAMAANQHHWCHKLPGGRFSEMLAHPIYLIRHFLGNDVRLTDVQASKFGGYPWMNFDEMAAIFKVGRKLGRAYSSFNSPRDAIYISLYGTESIVKLELINSILKILPKRTTNRFSKGFDSLRQAGQIIKSTGKNSLKIVFRQWMSGHDLYIKLFTESIIHGDEPPVPVEDGLATVKLLEETCRRISEFEKIPPA